MLNVFGFENGGMVFIPNKGIHSALLLRVGEINEMPEVMILIGFLELIFDKFIIREIVGSRVVVVICRGAEERECMISEFKVGGGMEVLAQSEYQVIRSKWPVGSPFKPTGNRILFREGFGERNW
jgi:hypothetical protein